MEKQRGTLPILEEPDLRSSPKNRGQKQDQAIWKPGKITRFIAMHQPKTPFIIINLDIIAGNYYSLQRALPMAEIFYAVKMLAGLGSSFDAASRQEIELVLAAGATPERISYGNTIKKEEDIAWAYEKGVRLFCFDAEAELVKLSRAAPGANVFVRIISTGDGADWPLSRKFGCDVDMAKDLLVKAKKMGMQPYGVSFHVGSQQMNPDAWDAALRQAADIFTSVRAAGITLKMVNLGGGLPAHYKDTIPSMNAYSTAIQNALAAHFGQDMPRIITEPGRSLVGDAGLIETEVVLVSKKSYADEMRWVYLDIGKFSGLAETFEEAIKYRIEVLGRRGATGPVTLAGPSCDSLDIIYEKHIYQLPLSLQVGDKLRIHSAGAYTSSYASVGFNGFPPPKMYCI